MAEKTLSKHLIHLESYFSGSSPILQKAGKVFHQLDQLEFDLGLIGDEDSVAGKSSWWPIVSLIGGFSIAKSEFINRYLNTDIHRSSHKFTVHQYTPQAISATLPGTALDADYRLPFYQISHKTEQAVKGEGSKINDYLELKTVHSKQLKGKLFVDTPIINPFLHNPVLPVLTRHILDMSDLVLVFTDLFDATPELAKESIAEIIAQQHTNKFIYVIDHSSISIDANRANEIIASWQSRLAELGIHVGQFIVLSESAQSTKGIEQRLANIEHDRSYRVLDFLEKSIRDVNDVYLLEVEKKLALWKYRSNLSTFIVLVLLVLAEIAIGAGISQLLFDPIIGLILAVVLFVLLVPCHLMLAKIHAKFIITALQNRQKELNLTENLAALFEKNLNFWRIILPISVPFGKNKKTQAKIRQLAEQAKGMVQLLNDQFNQQSKEQSQQPPTAPPQTSNAPPSNTLKP